MFEFDILLFCTLISVAINKQFSIHRICDQCEKEQSTFYCGECQLKYCESCNGVFHSKVILFLSLLVYSLYVADTFDQ